MKSKYAMNITVMDVLYYLGRGGCPTSGLALKAIENGWTAKTIVMSEEIDKGKPFYETIKMAKYKWRHKR